MNLRYPYYCHAKAFFGLYAIIPLGLIFALGFEYFDKWLKNKNLFLLRCLLFSWLGTLILAIFFSLIITPAQIQRTLDASTHHEKILQTDPDNYHANFCLASTYFSQRNYTCAVKHAEIALQQRHDWPQILDSFALILNSKPNATPSERNYAIKYAERSCHLTGYLDPSLLFTLANAYAAAGKNTDAIKTADRSLMLAAANGKHDLVKKIRERLEYYKSMLAHPTLQQNPTNKNSPQQ
jgi:tetratricopeptide (TPR) repeat protein